MSGFHSLLSAEAALVKVTDDLLFAADADSTYSILILLDLSSASDKVDLSALINRLRKRLCQ